MKRSIRTTFIGLFIGLLAMVLLAVWAMNSFFLENYYLNDKVKILQDTYIQINAYAMEKAAAGEDIMDDLQSLYSKDGEQNEITRLIRNVNEKYNITVVIVDSTNDETYPSFWDGRLLALESVEQRQKHGCMKKITPLKKVLTNMPKASICRTGASLKIIRLSLSCPCLLQVSMKA